MASDPAHLSPDPTGKSMTIVEAVSWPRRHETLYLAAGLAVLFVALGQGRLTDIDADTRRLITRQIWTRGTVFVRESDNPQLIRTARGKTSYFGLGQSVLFVPFDMGGWTLGRALTGDGEMRRYVEELPYSFLYCPLAGLAWWWSSALLGGALGLSRRESLLGSTLLCTSTIALHHLSQTQNEEPIIGTIVNLSLLHAVRWAGAGSGTSDAFRSGFWAGASILFRINAVFACALLLGVIADGVFRRRVGGRRLAGGIGVFLLGALGPVLLDLVGNAWRFGNPLETGYRLLLEQRDELSSRSPILPIRWDVAVGLLFGPGKGLFSTSPSLLIGLVGLVFLGRRRPFLSAGLAAVFALTAIFYSKLGRFPDGSISWGSRYHGHLVGLMVGPTMLAIRAIGRRGPIRAVAVGIIALSVGMQALSLLAQPALEYQRIDPDEPGFPLITSLARGQLALRAATVACGLVGRSDSELTAYRGAHLELFRREIPNFWGPCYAKRIGRPAIRAAVLAAWGANLLLGLAMVVHAIRLVRSESPVSAHEIEAIRDPIFAGNGERRGWTLDLNPPIAQDGSSPVSIRQSGRDASLRDRDLREG